MISEQDNHHHHHHHHHQRGMPSGCLQTAGESSAEASTSGVYPLHSSPRAELAGQPSFNQNLATIAARSCSGTLRAPHYENDIKERTKELLFGFHKYIEREDVYNAEELFPLAYIPKWYLGMLGLAATDESRAYQRNPRLKRTKGNFFIAPNPFYFDYDAFGSCPWKIRDECPHGFRLCVWWVHPVLQELSPYFDRKPSAVLNAERVEQLDKSGQLYQLCRRAAAAVGREEEEQLFSRCSASPSPDVPEDLGGPQELLMFDARPAISLHDLQSLFPVKYLHTWRDCGKEHVTELRQLRADVRAFLAEEFRMGATDLDAAAMVFHSTTRVRNPKFGDQTRKQYLHLHLQVYTGRSPDAVYLPSISCMQRSVALEDLVEVLRGGGNAEEKLLQFPHEYYDESDDFETFARCGATPDPSFIPPPSSPPGRPLFTSPPARKTLLPAVRMRSPDAKLERSPERVFSIELCRTDDEVRALATYHGLDAVFDSALWSWELVMRVLRRSFCGESISPDWTLDARRRKRPPQLHLVVGPKGVGKTTYVKEAVQGGRLGTNAFLIDGCNIRGEDGLLEFPKPQFQMKLELLRWCLRHGFDVVMTRAQAIGDKFGEWLRIVEEEEAGLAQRHSHPLRFEVSMHVIVAACATCAARATERDRPGDTAPCTYVQHREVYKAALEAVAGKMRVAARIDNLVVVDNLENRAVADLSSGFVTTAFQMKASTRPEAQLNLAKVVARAGAAGYPFTPHLVTVRKIRGHACPKLVLVRGPPGAGKTTLWRERTSSHGGACDCEFAGDASGGGDGEGLTAQATVADGEVFCREYAESWGITSATLSHVATDQHIRAARNCWKQQSIEHAFSQQQSLIVPITTDATMARELTGTARSHGYAVEVWVCLVDEKTNRARLRKRHQEAGTPDFNEEAFKESYRTLCCEYHTFFENPPADMSAAGRSPRGETSIRFFRDGKAVEDVDAAKSWLRRICSSEQSMPDADPN